MAWRSRCGVTLDDLVAELLENLQVLLGAASGVGDLQGVEDDEVRQADQRGDRSLREWQTKRIAGAHHPLRLRAEEERCDLLDGESLQRRGRVPGAREYQVTVAQPLR